MLLEILTNQISESSAVIVAACVLLSAGAMILDSLFEHRSTKKQATKSSTGCVWHNGSDGIDPCGVPFNGIEPMPEAWRQAVQPIVTPDGVPCLDGDPSIDLGGAETVLDNGEEAVANHGLAQG